MNEDRRIVADIPLPPVRPRAPVLLFVRQVAER